MFHLKVDRLELCCDYLWMKLIQYMGGKKTLFISFHDLAVVRVSGSCSTSSSKFYICHLSELAALGTQNQSGAAFQPRIRVSPFANNSSISQMKCLFYLFFRPQKETGFFSVLYRCS